MFPRNYARVGAYRVVAAKLPKDHALFLRQYSARTDTPINRILGALVADWVKLNQPINYQASPAPSASPVAVPSIPQTKRPREDTGRSEPAATLQAIDVAREEAKESGDTFAD
jgi:hypothetical protein